MRRLIDSMNWAPASRACKAAGEVNLTDVIVALAGSTSRPARR